MRLPESDLLGSAGDAGGAQDTNAGIQPDSTRSGSLPLHSLRAIVELIQQLKLSSDLFDLANTTVFNLMGHLGTPKAAMWLLPLTENEREPVLVACQGFSPERIETLGQSCQAELVDHFKQDRRPFDLAASGETLGSLAISLARSGGIALFAPLTSRDRLTGWVALGDPINGESYSSYKLEMLSASLDILSVALENTSYFSHLQENNRRLRLANDQLTELGEMKSQFMSNMNHELRTPLTIIVAYLQTLQDQDVDEAVRQEHLTLALEESGRLKSLITQLLDFSASNENRLQFDPVFHDVAALLRDFHALRFPGISADLREFSLDLKPIVPLACFDERRLWEVLDALVDNAVKFTPRGTRIRLGLDLQQRQLETWARIDVADNGPGIPQERQATLFDAFQQIDGSATRDVGGLGIGLALAKRYVELMGGKLQLQSELGMGTTFSLLLKLQSQPD